MDSPQLCLKSIFSSSTKWIERKELSALALGDAVNAFGVHEMDD
jgi:hypothetical protein